MIICVWVSQVSVVTYHQEHQQHVSKDVQEGERHHIAKKMNGTCSNMLEDVIKKLNEHVFAGMGGGAYQSGGG